MKFPLTTALSILWWRITSFNYGNKARIPINFFGSIRMGKKEYLDIMALTTKSTGLSRWF